MSRLPDWTVIWTGDGFRAHRLVDATIAMRPMSRHEAERRARKANGALATTDVVEAFGPGDTAS